MAGSLTDEQRAHMVAEYLRDGISADVIAERYSVSRNTVLRSVRRAGYSTRKHGKIPGYKVEWRPRAKRSGGRWIDKKGYVLTYVDKNDPLHTMCQGATNYAPEHRIVMAKTLGRPLLNSETVHHIDGNRQNNDINNLQLRQGHHGAGQAWSCLDCGSNNIQAIQLAAGG